MLARNLGFLFFALLMFNDACFSKKVSLCFEFDEWPDSLMGLSILLLSKDQKKDKKVVRFTKEKSQGKKEYKMKFDFQAYSLFAYEIRSKYKLPQTEQVSFASIPDQDTLSKICLTFTHIDGKNPKKHDNPWYIRSLVYHKK